MRIRRIAASAIAAGALAVAPVALAASTSHSTSNDAGRSNQGVVWEPRNGDH